MKKSIKVLMLIAMSAIFVQTKKVEACTGITLKTLKHHTIVARTIEWGGSLLNSSYSIVPRGFEQYVMLDATGQKGMKFKSKYGFVGLSVEQPPFVVEGLNEKGLSMGLFYFPGYGQYQKYNPKEKSSTINDLQLTSYVLGACANVNDAINLIKRTHIIALDKRASTVHWRIADASGRQIVVEITNGVPHFYENKIGVLTNAPGFMWQMTNLNNYVNLMPGGPRHAKIGNLNLYAFGAGSGLRGIPGDVTPPSRFVRAAFFQASTPPQKTDMDAVLQCFHILNNFDIPLGVEFDYGKAPVDMPSATQWTSATDINGLKLYFKTMYNSQIRCLDLNKINFSKVRYQTAKLDNKAQESIQYIAVK